MGRAENLEFLKASYRGKRLKEYDELCDWLFHDRLRERSVALCAHRAYRDLCRNLAGLGKMNVSDKKKWREDTERYIESSIEVLLTGQPEDFDGWHHETCLAIQNKALEHQMISYLNNGLGFPHGLAQKWLNMTLKYMLVLEKWDSLIAPYRARLHVPVDSYIMEAASAMLRVGIPARNGRASPYGVTCSKPWSQWNFEEYTQFQKELSEAVLKTGYPSAAAWEADAWIKIKEKRESKGPPKKGLAHVSG